MAPPTTPMPTTEAAFSDPVWEVDSATWYSYLASSAEIVTALLMAGAGWLVIRSRGLESFSTARA